MELGLEATSENESGVDLGRESDGSTGLELGDDAVAVGTSRGTAPLMLVTGSVDVELGPESGSDVAGASSDAVAAKVSDGKRRRGGRSGGTHQKTTHGGDRQGTCS